MIVFYILVNICFPYHNVVIPNYRCSSCIYVLNYCMHKLYLHIICLPFYTFQRWWWMRRWLYNQKLNIQHSFFLCSFQLLFYLCYFQQFCFLLLPSFVFTPLRFLFPCYLLWFSIALFAFILLWIPKLQKCAQLPTSANCFRWLPHFFRLWTSHPSHSFFHLPLFYN